MSNYLAKNFYKNLPHFFHYLGIYVVGDLIVLLPFIVVFFPLVYLFRGLEGLVISWCLYMGIRHMFEVVYWLLQQFGDKSYRPATPFKQLKNNDVYILHQLLNTVYAVIYLSILIFILIS